MKMYKLVLSLTSIQYSIEVKFIYRLFVYSLFLRSHECWFHVAVFTLDVDDMHTCTTDVNVFHYPYPPMYAYPPVLIVKELSLQSFNVSLFIRKHLDDK